MADVVVNFVNLTNFHTIINGLDYVMVQILISPDGEGNFRSALETFKTVNPTIKVEVARQGAYLYVPENMIVEEFLATIQPLVVAQGIGSSLVANLGEGSYTLFEAATAAYRRSIEEAGDDYARRLRAAAEREAAEREAAEREAAERDAPPRLDATTSETEAREAARQETLKSFEAKMVLFQQSAGVANQMGRASGRTATEPETPLPIPNDEDLKKAASLLPGAKGEPGVDVGNDKFTFEQNIYSQVTLENIAADAKIAVALYSDGNNYRFEICEYSIEGIPGTAQGALRYYNIEQKTPGKTMANSNVLGLGIFENLAAFEKYLQQEESFTNCRPQQQHARPR